ncbi:MAG: membrane integrity-associated transporter subunit PqiC [Ignavibacteria bacterium]|nr:membrane integrity-associated transporter subunit PqiC [Ignavibacteria bacterium]
MNKYILFCFCCLLASCISLKTEYQKTSYYRLTQQPTVIKKIEPLPGTLLIRSVNVDGEFDTDKLMQMNGENELQPYNYHRWASDLSELATNFIVNRFSEYHTFTGGVVSTASVSTPTYILESRISELVARNSESLSRDSNTVHLTMTVSLLRFNLQKADKALVFQKSYSISKTRSTNAVTTIPPAVSIAFSSLCDELLVDIQHAISH